MCMPLIPGMPPLCASASDGAPRSTIESPSELATRLVVTISSFREFWPDPVSRRYDTPSASIPLAGPAGGSSFQAVARPESTRRLHSLAHDGFPIRSHDQGALANRLQE